MQTLGIPAQSTEQVLGVMNKEGVEETELKVRGDEEGCREDIKTNK